MHSSYLVSGVGDHDERGGVKPVRGGGAQPPEGAAEVAPGQDREVGLGEVLREHRQPRLEVLAHLGEHEHSLITRWLIKVI